MQDDEPICTSCGVPIIGDHKYLVFRQTRTGYALDVGCAHVRPSLKNIIGIAGGARCAAKILAQIMDASEARTHAN